MSDPYCGKSNNPSAKVVWVTNKKDARTRSGLLRLNTMINPEGKHNMPLGPLFFPCLGGCLVVSKDPNRIEVLLGTSSFFKPPKSRFLKPIHLKGKMKLEPKAHILLVGHLP